MPLKRYGVVKGRAIAAKREEDQSSPHYQVHLRAGSIPYRIAVNVKSPPSPSELLFLVDDDFTHPMTATLPNLSDEFTLLWSKSGGQAVDFIRGEFFDRSNMRLLPVNMPGRDNDLSEQLEHYVLRAMQEPDARVYAFGERWGPEGGKADKIFGFRPGNGIRDIHMNQGNGSRFSGNDGVWQDGALMVHFPSTRQWIGVFLAFQSQSWHTDDRTGHAGSDVRTPIPLRS